jgi:uncharacterized protein (UPF0333 family)
MISKKAQSSMELLILMGFLTFVIIGILGIGYFYSNTINDRIKASQVSNFAEKLIATSESVYYAGGPSKSTINAHLPDGVENLNVSEEAITITYDLTSGENIISFESSVPIVEDSSNPLTSTSGVKSITVIANETHAIISQN